MLAITMLFGAVLANQHLLSSPALEVVPPDGSTVISPAKIAVLTSYPDVTQYCFLLDTIHLGCRSKPEIIVEQLNIHLLTILVLKDGVVVELKHLFYEFVSAHQTPLRLRPIFEAHQTRENSVTIGLALPLAPLSSQMVYCVSVCPETTKIACRSLSKQLFFQAILPKMDNDACTVLLSFAGNQNASKQSLVENGSPKSIAFAELVAYRHIPQMLTSATPSQTPSVEASKVEMTAFIFACKRIDSLTVLWNSFVKALETALPSLQDIFLRVVFVLDRRREEDGTQRRVLDRVNLFRREWALLFPTMPAVNVMLRRQHLGLRESILTAWKDYRARVLPRENHVQTALYLEDDVELSSAALLWLAKAVQRYKTAFGISLYRPHWDEINQMAFSPGKGPFSLQVPCSWGALYFWEPWEQFLNWLELREEDGHVLLPRSHSNHWENSWKRPLLRFLTEQSMTVVYAGDCLSTTWVPPGEHSQGDHFGLIHCSLQLEALDWKFPRMCELPSFDVYHRRTISSC